MFNLKAPFAIIDAMYRIKVPNKQGNKMCGIISGYWNTYQDCEDGRYCSNCPL